MAFAGNPRKHAADVADGYVLLSPVALRGQDLGSLRTFKQALEIELRDTRAATVPPDDPLAAQRRQRRILRLNQALGVLRTFALKRKLPL